MSSIVFLISLNKKTKITTKKTLRKTGLEDQENIRNELLNSDVTICEICLKEEDQLSDATIQWVECSMCRVWVYTH